MDLIYDFTPLNSAAGSPVGTPRLGLYDSSLMGSQDPISFSENSSDAFMALLTDALKSDDLNENLGPSPNKKRRKTTSSFSQVSSVLSTSKPGDASKEKKKRSVETKKKKKKQRTSTDVADGNGSSGAESVQSTGSRSGKTGKKRSIEETKASHRAIERRRTRRLNDLIQKIKGEVISEGMQCRKDKASILQAAIDCIHNLRSKAAHLSNKLNLSKMREKAYFEFAGSEGNGVLRSDFSVSGNDFMGGSSSDDILSE
eukprot:g3387.t1